MLNIFLNPAIIIINNYLLKEKMAAENNHPQLLYLGPSPAYLCSNEYRRHVQ